MENTLITQDRLTSLINLCQQTRAQNIAEVGVYKGGSLKYLAENFPKASLTGFDTFKGLPKDKWNDKEIHQPGEFSETNIEDVREFINSKYLNLIEGVFPESAKPVEHVKYDFVHIDTDFYQSVKESIEWFWPRMNKGGIIVFDDFQWPNCPGVKQALEEFGQPIHRAANYQAYLIKQ